MRCSLRILWVLVFVCCLAQPCLAGPTTLVWAPSPDSTVTGYIVSVGTSPGVYTQTFDVGPTTTWVPPALSPAQTYYFSVQAYDQFGTRSDYSNSVILPANARLVPDFGTDGTADIVWQHPQGWLSVWHMQKEQLGSAVLLQPAQVTDPNWQVVAIADIDGDGKTDLIWRHQTSGLIAAWLMNGTVLQRDVLLTPSTVSDPRWKIVATADMDNDGHVDLIWQHDGGTVAAWLMNGTVLKDSVLLSPSSVPAGTWRIVGAADLDQDGKADLLWQHPDGWLAAWLMDGVVMRDSPLLNPQKVGGGTSWAIRGVADFNQDGRPDLLWQHVDGWISIWYMDGLSLVDAVLVNPSRVPPGTWKIVGPR